MTREQIWLANPGPCPASFRGLRFEELWKLLDDADGQRIDENRLRHVVRRTHEGRELYVKFFEGIQLKNALRLRFLSRPRCHTQAAREHAVIRGLRSCGFRVPEVLLRAERTRFGHELSSILVLAPLDGFPLETRLGELGTEAYLTVLATRLGMMVKAGIFLPDLGTDHVFCDSRSGFGFLDFHNARFAPRPSNRELARAVVRFFRSPGAELLLERSLLWPFAERYFHSAGRPQAREALERLAKERLAR